MTDDTLYKFSIIVLTSMPVFITAMLFFIAAKINNQIDTNNSKIEKISNRLEAEKAELYGLRVLSGMSLRFISEAYTLLDLERRQILDILDEVKISRSKTRQEVFRKHTNAALVDFSRLSLYLSLMVPSNGNEIELTEKISDLVEKFEDHDTLKFLGALSNIETSDNSKILSKAHDKLSVKLYGYDSSLWTGRK